MCVILQKVELVDLSLPNKDFIKNSKFLKQENYLGRTRHLYNGKNVFSYRFKCNNCEGELSLQYNYVKSSKGLCKSCIKKNRPFETAYNELKRAKRHKGNKEVLITYEDFLEFTKKPLCHYCLNKLDWQPYTKINGQEMKGARSYKLDRKDNNKAYTKENCVQCCWSCNQTKSNRYSYEEFYKMTDHKRIGYIDPDLETQRQRYLFEFNISVLEAKF